MMALAARTDARGFVRCEACGQRFKVHHSCRVSALGYTPRRPDGFQELVDEAAAEERAAKAAGDQLTIDDLALACTRCGSTDRHVDEDSGLCTKCMAADAREQAARVADWYAPGGPGRSPP
ncbi:hypothetical protein G7075_04470 [Phycicoccus sp. HDW14]|uniref:hypothetical protein n=1 Tax=Phycicoccus sp. HDW14 TaxID=2714941 RepID=UPI001409DE63|nr:hypothetical protein [Phycicoccus sp. HDW14]QIM20572.1 hypothetical protein G7075_04470 [Phycicoccus sp. HDW14]